MKNQNVPQEKLKIIEENQKLKEQQRKLAYNDRVLVNQKIEEIKQKSEHFRITHARRFVLNGSEVVTLPIHTANALAEAGEDVEILANGGLTVIEATKNGKRFVGVSRCHKNDNFSRHDGRKYALRNLEFNGFVDAR